MAKLLRFHIPGRAVPKGRPRMTRTGGVYTPKTTVDYEKVVAEAWNQTYGMLSLNGKLRVTINVHTDRHAKQDVDNLAKSILDGMQRAGAFIDGDHQVYSLGVVKHPAETELGVWVSVIGLDDYDEPSR
jgi:Holliday junction resolvase RusA-like endonuclease